MFRPPRDSADGVQDGTLVGGLVPAALATAETREEALEEALFPDEERSLAGVAPARRREFVAGRACARRALTSLGVPRTPIGVGARSEPLWPDGVVGSITHCDGYRAAAVGRAADAAAVGIDAEPNAPLAAPLLARVASARELAAVGIGTYQGAAGRAPVCLDKLIFSAKEAVYKAWFPLTRRPLEFRDVELSIDLARGGIRARLLVRPPVIDGREVRSLVGRWRAERGLLCVAVVLPRAR